MEKFDIETFNKNKTGNEWDITGEEIDIEGFILTLTIHLRK